ncbi:hypothetical protein [Tepidibacter aestuarii]|nr:hypothetical protein [Tepidibacter aestuarii]CAH2212525.1 protein of unknown function [Tepidibacter aestuarii]
MSIVLVAFFAIILISILFMLMDLKRIGIDIVDTNKRIEEKLNKIMKK